MSDIGRQVSEVLSSLNWLMEPHEGRVELIEIQDSRVVIRCTGYCACCRTDCIGEAFKEKLPDMELIIHYPEDKTDQSFTLI